MLGMLGIEKHDSIFKQVFAYDASGQELYCIGEAIGKILPLSATIKMFVPQTHWKLLVFQSYMVSAVRMSHPAGIHKFLKTMLTSSPWPHYKSLHVYWNSN